MRTAASWTKREVVVALLLPADEQAAEAVEPGMRDLHDPPPRRVAVGMAGRRAGAGRCWPWAECGARSHGRGRSPGRRHSRSRGPDTTAGAPRRVRRRARPASRSCAHRAGPPASSCPCGWPPRRCRPAARPCRRSADGVWCRICRGRWGWLPSIRLLQAPFFAERRFDQAAVGTLPVQVEPHELIVFF